MSSSSNSSLDAAEIAALLPQLKRPTARAAVEQLVQQLQSQSEEKKQPDVDDKATAAASLPSSVVSPPPRPMTVTTTGPTDTTDKPVYTTIDRFSFDFGSSSTPFVTLYIPLPVTMSRDDVTLECTESSFDLIVKTSDGKSYRLYRDQLEKKIIPDKCKFTLKDKEVRLKLAKVKGEYGSYDYWSKLTDDKKKKTKTSSSDKDNPADSIMSLMKDMYDSGDDNMKKMIGETMMKQQRGELGSGGMGDDFGKI